MTNQFRCQAVASYAMQSGPLGRSEGCITVKDAQDFERLSAYRRAQGATLPIPGSNVKAYGILEVQ
ncbi:hypothetical protein BamMEX5DRAFT_4795 [Burkholderia ambifaria MEX-5]|uniref:DUF2778 domain-containing protein n=1 Tax=Burkholderia ambifaria MEX-5 TaxID=396597 RepID=B1TAH9_9BURK|nr:hypothetical protein BamMEX5DRAFT_4795 [Burkholderia ambifaria MEX-5]